MVAIRINGFGGMIPRLGDQILPDGAASFAENTLLLSGELRGVRGVQLVWDFSARDYLPKRVYRITDGGGEQWIAFPDKTVDMVKAPIVNDAANRYYWTSDNYAPRYATLNDLVLADALADWEPDPPGHLLGIPAPDHTDVDMFTVTPDQSGVGEQVTRAYTYTFVSLYGEESAPALAVVETGYTGDTWTISGMKISTDVPDNDDRVLTGKNIYRTITTLSGLVEYHLVDSVGVDVTSYDDDIPTDEVALNSTLESEFWSVPPDDMLGLLTHPNGFLVGFHGRELYMSEPYRPHAWPQQYVLSMESDILGLGVYGTSIAICTRAHPYIASGIHPGAMTLTKAQTPNPCISDRRGVVTMPFGVYYPSDTGLMLMSASGFTNATQQLLTKSEWRRDYTPSQLRAARWQSQYIAFHSTEEGFMFAPDESQSAFVELRHHWHNDEIQNDDRTGEVFIIREQQVLSWNPATGLSETYTWESKEYVTPDPVNFGALALEYGEELKISEELLSEYQDYNDFRFPWPLNPLNWHAINTVRGFEEKTSTENPQDPLDHPTIGLTGYTPPKPFRESHRQPFHGSPLYRTGPYTPIGGVTPGAVGSVVVSVYADDTLVWEETIVDEEQYRLPAGYKARRWKFKLTGTLDVASLKIAETGKELASV